MSSNNINIIDKFNELLNYNSDDEINDEEKNICMITNNKLEDNYIELSCGHKFNYIPLYKEVKYQKTNKYSLSYDNIKLDINQIKCPYCRNITNNILPYFKYYNLETIRGVNIPNKYSLKIYSCQHKNKNTNNLCNNTACITSNGILCNKHYCESISKRNYNLEYNNIKVTELRDMLRKNGARVGGNKQVLIDRIILEKNNNPYWINL